MTQIAPGGTEVIVSNIVNFVGQDLSGKADITLHVRRVSDGLTYDWDDATFKTLGACVEPRRVMTEANASDYPGEYSESFTTPGTAAVYTVTVDQTPRTDAFNVPQCGEIRTNTVSAEVVTGGDCESVGYTLPSGQPIVRPKCCC